MRRLIILFILLVTSDLFGANWGPGPKRSDVPIPVKYIYLIKENGDYYKKIKWSEYIARVVIGEMREYKDYI